MFKEMKIYLVERDTCKEARRLRQVDTKHIPLKSILNETDLQVHTRQTNRPIAEPESVSCETSAVF